MTRYALAFVPLILLLAGCGGNTLPPETNPAEGRDILKTALDAWVRGGKPEDLKNGSPSIVVYDPDWAEGHKLVKYDIAPEDRRIGVDLLLSVKLTLSKAGGAPQEKKVNMGVAINGDQRAVIRKE